jgi:hypothetical protein
MLRSVFTQPRSLLFQSHGLRRDLHDATYGLRSLFLRAECVNALAFLRVPRCESHFAARRNAHGAAKTLALDVPCGQAVWE